MPVPQRSTSEDVSRLTVEELIDKAHRENWSELSLSGCALNKVPLRICELTQLKALYLMNNFITSLPDCIGELSNLRVLNAQGNQINNLPETIGSLKELRTLFLPNNALSQLPDSLSDLQNLEMLNMTGNRFKEIPDCVTENQFISELLMMGNRLVGVPDNIEKMKMLKVIDIRDNHVRKLPDNMMKLIRLEKIIIEDNFLEELNESLSELKCLKEIYLKGNSNLEIPDEILGPTYAEVVSSGAKPKKPQAILDFYFQKREKKSKDFVRVFVSYSHQDERLRKKLETHLSIMRRKNIVHIWHDRKIGAGTEWKDEIDGNLEDADIVLLLISSDFLASDYCYDKEMKRALERHDEGRATVIPIIVRDCSWHDADFGRLQALPKDGKAVTLWSNQDTAWRNVSEGIKQRIDALRQF